VFGAISVWDGHKVGNGRIVCDATWHHFVNQNLDGTEAVFAPGNRRVGLRDPVTLAFTRDFHQIAEYYRNIADWLIPAGRRWCQWWIDILIERFRFPLIEEWRALPPPPCPWDARVKLGILVEEAFNAHRGIGFGAQLVMEAIGAATSHDGASFITPITTSDRTLIDPDVVRRGILGSIFDSLVADLPNNPADLHEALEGTQYHTIVERVSNATREAMNGAVAYYADAAGRTVEVVTGHAPTDKT
jgi:hypothetical protein